MFKPKGFVGLLQKLGLLLVLMAIAGVMGWGTGQWWLQRRTQQALQPEVSPSPSPSLSPQNPLATENDVRARLLNLGLSPTAFRALVTDVLEQPDTATASPDPSPSPSSSPLPPDSLKTQTALLTALESLSPDARRYLQQNLQGPVPPDDRRQWVPRVNQLRLSSRSFYDLVNAHFRLYFPDIDPDSLGDRPMEHLWNALAFDHLVNLENGTQYERLALEPGTPLTSKGELQGGIGRAYAIKIAQGDRLTLELTAPPSVRLSFYSPSGQTQMLKNSPVHTWSGPLSETGYYELVITPTQPDPAPYQIRLDLP